MQTLDDIRIILEVLAALFTLSSQPSTLGITIVVIFLFYLLDHYRK